MQPTADLFGGGKLNYIKSIQPIPPAGAYTNYQFV